MKERRGRAPERRKKLYKKNVTVTQPIEYVYKLKDTAHS